ncbi:MAG: cytosine permease [Actinomycetota bacterium]|nr:cytosine permease [Actinomycetota bacterium]
MTVADVGHHDALTADEVFRIERRGIDYVPESERWATPRSLFGMWAGAITNFEIFIYGAILMAFFGVTFYQAVVLIVVGNLSYLLLGLTSLQGPDAGTTTFTVNRAAYGPNGGRVMAFFNWLTQVGFETEGLALVVLAGIALAAKAGFAAGTPAKIVLIVLAAGIQLLLPLFGHGTILKVLKWLAIPFVALFVILAVLTAGKVHLHGVHPGAGWAEWMAGLAFVIVLSGLGWTENGNDYSRYIPRQASKASIVGWVFAGTFIPSVLLMTLGAAVGTYVPTLATKNPMPALPHVFAAWFLIPFLIVAVIQLFSINSLDLYSSGVTLQALGLRLKRWQAVLVDTVIAGGLTAYAIFSSSFTTLLTDFVDCVIVWIAPWTAIFLVDWLMRRRRYVPGELQKEKEGLYWRNGGFHWPAIIAQVVGMFASLMGLSQTFFHGLLASHTGDADFSVFLGLGVGGGLYAILAWRSVRREASTQVEMLDAATGES